MEPGAETPFSGAPSVCRARSRGSARTRGPTSVNPAPGRWGYDVPEPGHGGGDTRRQSRRSTPPPPGVGNGVQRFLPRPDRAGLGSTTHARPDPRRFCGPRVPLADPGAPWAARAPEVEAGQPPVSSSLRRGRTRPGVGTAGVPCPRRRRDPEVLRLIFGYRRPFYPWGPEARAGRVPVPLCTYAVSPWKGRGPLLRFGLGYYPSLRDALTQ